MQGMRKTISGALGLVLMLTACGPIGFMSGGRIYGEVVPGPIADWSFSDAHMQIQVETRPSFPHSVTTIAWVHDGALHVPAMNPEGKRWTQHVLADPRVRLRIGDKVYAGRAVRVGDETSLESHRASVEKKYPQLAERDAADLPPIWVFRIDPLQ